MLSDDFARDVQSQAKAAALRCRPLETIEDARQRIGIDSHPAVFDHHDAVRALTLNYQRNRMPRRIFERI